MTDIITGAAEKKHFDLNETRVGAHKSESVIINYQSSFHRPDAISVGLHMVQLMPLHSRTSSSLALFKKTGFTFLVPACPGCPGKGTAKQV